MGGPDVSAPQQPLMGTLARVGSLVAEDGVLLAGAVAFMVLAAGVELTIPHFITAAVFAAAQTGSGTAFRTALLRLTLAAGVFAVTAGLRGYLFSLLNLGLLQRLRSRAFRAMITQPVSWLEGVEGGQLTSRLGSDCASASRMVATSANVALRNGIQCVGAGVYLYTLHPLMAAAAVGVATALGAAAAAYGAFSREAQRSYQDALAAASARAEESFLLAPLVRAFGTEGDAAARYDTSLLGLAHISRHQAVAYGGFVVANHWGYNAMRAATLAVGGAAALQGHISTQQLTSFMLYVELFASATLSVADQYGPIMESLGASERVVSYLDMKPAAQLGPGATLDDVQGDIEFRNISFSYPSRPGSLALDRVSLLIPAGRTVAFVGLSGSGKTTLVALLQRLYDPVAGAVKLDGHDLRSLDAAWYRRQLGVVSQDPHLFSMTVAENIAYGTPGATRAAVVGAAELANASGFIERLPQGYDTLVTDRLLSGGQRQRIAIARALIRDPKVLILDEATSALDSESEAAVHAALDRAIRQSGRTVLVIAHRLSTVANADLTIVMAGGKVAERGTHAELVRRGGLYASLVARQSGKMAAGRDLAPHEAQGGAQRPPLAPEEAEGPGAEPSFAGMAETARRGSVDECK